jgi:hypothetical protein
MMLTRQISTSAQSLLCKISQFESIFHYDPNTSLTLDLLGQTAQDEQGNSWVQGANTRSHLKFLIPLTPDQNELTVSIATVIVGNFHGSLSCPELTGASRDLIFDHFIQQCVYMSGVF